MSYAKLTALPEQLYRNNLKNRFLTASAFPQNSCLHSRLGPRQWSLAPDKNFEGPPCQNPDSSGCFGIHRTAAELIVERANPKLPNMGLKSWKGSRVRQQDVTIAKNYLDHPEIEELNRIVVMYLDHAEDQARRRRAMTMAEWEEKLDAFLLFKERDLLDHAGKISAQVAQKLAFERYEEFDEKRRETEKLIADDEDMAVLEGLQAVAKSRECFE